MSKTIHFTKMHGAGNDYIYVNTLLYSIPDPSAASIAWSKPHTGIGSDGLVLIGKPKDEEKADYAMRIFNADGSEAMMCGNASRCIAKYLYEKGITDKTTIRLETLSGVKILSLHLKAGKVESVTVDMLEPAFDVKEQFTGHTPDELNSVKALSDHVLRTEDGKPKSLFVSMGNPHYVIFVDDVQHMDITTLGKLLEREKAFPQRCNIEFAQLVGEGKLRTRVWERGSGITMACGTGACATAVAAAKLGVCGRHAVIAMDGGDLDITWSPNDNHVYMTGPAAFAFEGDIELPEDK
ncbi:diaminopimelate epimerase [Hallella mizrahii]|uniref:Diaminopimelate epimerase n=1 Tax=Hallella mizrahii TaxID=2606637 RepID=A0A7K0KD98_9BACT|nr:diaminopimelate epimerase [Hallella mizrahii]MST83903.1 diaminopimelate epimerase [Hallella mizrahii]